jgi:SagB-type dehydrogenase family enzyme
VSPARRGEELRRAWALVATLDGAGLQVRNFVQDRSTWLGPAELSALGSAERWLRRRDLLRTLRAAGSSRPGRTLDRLVERGVLVTRRSNEARADSAFRATWAWGEVAAAFHRGIRDPPFLGHEEGLARLGERAAGDPPPRLVPREGRRRQRLPPPRLEGGPLRLLGRRRSRRLFSEAPLDPAALADVLYAGLGVRRVVRDPVQGDLPLKLAPSGGGRNPIDGYLYVRRVRGVAPGVYRYSGPRRDLEWVKATRIAPQLLLGGQEWTDGAAAVVFLVASFHRTGWKYRSPVAYRVVLLEAGHIAQNLLVAACGLGLAATPTCAFADSLAEVALGVSGPDRGLLHAVVLGRPAPQRESRARSARSSSAGP